MNVQHDAWHLSFLVLFSWSKDTIMSNSQFDTC
jgi:hypothetical protein